MQKHTANKIKEGGLPGLYDLKKIWNPAWLQGNRQRDGYFEGWYFRMTSADGRHSWAFIPGLSLGGGQDHCFVQAIDGQTGRSWYFRYPIEAFSYSKKDFHVTVGNSAFSRGQIELELADDSTRFAGSIRFSDQTAYSAGLRRPGIMGWYRYVPFMECYHGVVSPDHATHGSLTMNGQSISFDDGRGYIEKDWGRSMPQAWIWMQTNHFPTPRTSFMMSIARIPWLGSSFTGFLGFFLTGGKRYDFATYTGARVQLEERPGNQLNIKVKARDFDLEVMTDRGASGALKAPVSGTMQRIIHESIDAAIMLKLSDKSGKTLFEEKGKHAGLETVGNLEILKN